MKNGSVEEIVECLGNGGVVLLPTDTVYGLAVSPNFDTSIDRLFALKRRPTNVNLPIMVSSDEDLEPLGFEISESETTAAVAVDSRKPHARARV